MHKRVIFHSKKDRGDLPEVFLKIKNLVLEALIAECFTEGGKECEFKSGLCGIFRITNQTPCTIKFQSLMILHILPSHIKNNH